MFYNDLFRSGGWQFLLLGLSFLAWQSQVLIDGFDGFRAVFELDLVGFWAVFSPLLAVATLLPHPVQVLFLVSGLFALERWGEHVKRDLRDLMPTDYVSKILI